MSVKDVIKGSVYKQFGIGYTVSPDPFDEYPEFADCPLRI